MAEPRTPPTGARPAAPGPAGDARPRGAAGRRAAFVVLAVVCLGTALGYALIAAQRPSPAALSAGGPARNGTADVAEAEAEAEAEMLRDIAPGMLLFRDLRGAPRGRLAASATDAGDAPRSVADLVCERIHYAAGTGVCLTVGQTPARLLSAVFFGPDLAVRATAALPGIASRTRVSPDGRLAATTVFVTGHSYAPGSFSTETMLWNTTTGRPLARLSDFEVERDGAPFAAIDFNFWGVTFSRDGARFHATLSTGGVPYLVEGDIAARRMRVLMPQVECPSLSPDGRRIAFKRTTRNGHWELRVLDLQTRAETAMQTESNTVDDQVEWLDDRTLLYARPRSADAAGRGEDIWALDVSGAAPPLRLRSHASSPAVVR